ncbi:MAG: L-rhamnose isomerase [Phycisphaerales bacterium JB063]
MQGDTAGYQRAEAVYATHGVDVAAALHRLTTVSIALPCWQGDDVKGFEDNSVAGSHEDMTLSGASRGRARNADELRQDMAQALRLIPGAHRVGLHASYRDSGTHLDRDAIGVEHFAGWIDWAREQKLGLDFNPTLFSHPLSADGFTLSHPDAGVRAFWVSHCQRSRAIAAEIAQQLGGTCVNNLWIPDGYKDMPVDRFSPRRRLIDSLDAIYLADPKRAGVVDTLESKLFGIGSETYVVGSHEFYLGYASSRGLTLCLDAGHFHPTESVADKVSSMFCYFDSLHLHFSRGVRWDSDHVVSFDDQTRAIAGELVRGDCLEKTHWGADFFDPSINRVAAWVIGARSILKSVLYALLEPNAALLEQEQRWDYTRRLATFEASKTLPFGEVWEHFCRSQGVPGEWEWMREIERYEAEVLSSRE